MSNVDWLAECVANGESSFRVGRFEGQLIAEWIGIARIVASRDGQSSQFIAEPDAYGPDVEKIQKGSARLLLRHLHGKLSLHGACIARRDDAIILLGRSGEGKSTQAASLCSRGADLLSDDAVAVERLPDPLRYECLPCEANHWLEPSAMRALGFVPPGDWKSAVPSTHIATSPAALRAVVDLAYVDGAPVPRLVRVRSPIAAMGALVPQVVRFVLDEPEVQRREVEMLAEFIAHVPMFRLERPRGFEHLPAATALLLELLDGGRSTLDP